MLVIDPGTQTLSFIEGAGTSGEKYFDICAGPDGRLYCAPANASKVLVIDAATRSCSFIKGVGDGGSRKYAGVCPSPHGQIYLAPLNSVTVMCISVTNTLQVLE